MACWNVPEAKEKSKDEENKRWGDKFFHSFTTLGCVCKRVMEDNNARVPRLRRRQRRRRRRWCGGGDESTYTRARTAPSHSLFL